MSEPVHHVAADCSTLPRYIVINQTDFGYEAQLDELCHHYGSYREMTAVVDPLIDPQILTREGHSMERH